MANGLINNVFIIDSAQGNTALSIPDKCRVQAVAFWAADSNSVLRLSGVNTTNILFKIGNPTGLDGTYSVYVGGVDVGTLKAPTVTGGTGWIYIS
jgi:hypothetical protein